MSRPAASRWPMSPVWYQPSVGERRGRRLGVVPVALEQRSGRGTGSRRRRRCRISIAGRRPPDRARARGRRGVVHAAGPGLGRAVALEDDDAEVLPAPAGGPAAGTRRPTRTAGGGRRAARGRSGRAAAGRASAGGGRSPRRRSNVGASGRASRPRARWRSRTGRGPAGTTTIEVTRWSRRASKMTRGLRLRTYRMSAPTISA